jgi:S-adenosylmethionine:tRNA ribosyltransferase-isomerase
MNIKEFDYHLPKQLIAQHPAKNRDLSRLLVLNRRSGKIKHCFFRNITEYFSPGDALVFNDTKVRPASLTGKIGDKDIGILLVERIFKNKYLVKAKPAKKLRQDTVIDFAGGKYKAVAKENDQARDQAMRCIEFQYEHDIETVLDEFGKMPLPPYIKRQATDSDARRYQTVYARNPGAIASPTAGLHFTDGILKELNLKDINTFYLTLHVGLGTFLPVKVDNLEDHKMHSEYYYLSKETAEDIVKVKKNKKRICAVGTTVCRVLESCSGNDEAFSLKSGRGKTDIFIYPPYEFKAVDMLLTNFHLPKTTLLMLVSAFAGKDLIMKAYKQAVEEEYRFFSYGDAMLII